MRKIIYTLIFFGAGSPFILGGTQAIGSIKPVARQIGKQIGTGEKKPTVTLESPKGGWSVDRMVLVKGSVSDTTIDPVLININGDRYLLRTRAGSFSRAFPVASGKNSVSVIATNKGGTTTVERTVFGQISPVAMSVVLTSDTDGVYTDLHIYEPSETQTGGASSAGTKKEDSPSRNREDSRFEHVYWANTVSPTGGKFYLNEQGGDFDQPGYGPYLYTHTAPPVGFYRIDANYWPSGDKAHTVGFLNLVLFGGTPSEIRKRVRIPLVSPGQTSTLAWIKMEKAQKATVWIPSNEKKPAVGTIWPQWVLDIPTEKSNSHDD